MRYPQTSAAPAATAGEYKTKTGEGRGHLLLVLHVTDGAADVVVDRLELLGALGGEGLAAGLRRDVRHRGGIGRHGHGFALHDHRAFGGAERDRVDLHCRRLGVRDGLIDRRHRRARVAVRDRRLTVAHQHDGGRHLLRLGCRGDGARRFEREFDRVTRGGAAVGAQARRARRAPPPGPPSVRRRSAALVENDTSPSWTPFGRASRKLFAADFAAVNRSGATSRATIDPDTSIARMTVACCRGVRTVCAGCANPMVSSSSVKPSIAGAT